MAAKLYLVPVPLGDSSNWQLAEPDRSILHQITVFIVENGKTARRFLKHFQHPIPMLDMQFLELNEHTPAEEVPALLDAALASGKDIAVLSEAGCPCVADPGADVVRLAHQRGIDVVPWVGPSSILLALMGSGMSGQRFAFHGYLPVQPPARKKELQQLEQLSRRQDQTQIFIETPYRNEALMRDLLATLSADTLLCVAADLSLPTQYLRTQSVRQWKEVEMPALHKRPAIFLIKG